MLRLAVLAISFAAASAVTISHESKSAGVTVISVSSIDEYIAQHPEVKSVQKLEKSWIEERERFTITYTLGNRVNGDGLVSTHGFDDQWDSDVYVKVSMKHPESGYGSVVTYLAFNAYQSTPIGQAYVVRGGIGQRSIEVIFEAITSHFYLRGQLFGYN